MKITPPLGLEVPQNIKSRYSTIESSTKRMVPYWIGAAATALVSVIYARAFGISEEWAHHWFQANPLLAFVIVPFGLLASTLMAHFITTAASGSGIPQLLVAVETVSKPNSQVDKLLSLKMVATKFFGSCLSVASGGVTGREGPMLQISAALFNLIHKRWPIAKTKPDLRPMILAGGAAGLAAAFNTPLGGVIFAIEELAKDHISQIRTYVFHAVIIAGILAQAFLGNYLYFGKIEITAAHSYEFFPLVACAAVIGIVGALLGRFIVTSLDFRARLSFKMKVVMTLICGLVVSSILFFWGAQSLGSGRAVIVELLSKSEASSIDLGFARIFGNLFTYIAGAIGGIFAPSLASGAALGSWLSQLVPESHHQLWVLTGMVAFLTGVTRTPFTSLILVLEMTDTHNVIINLMVAAIVAQGAARLVDPISFYEHMAHRMIHGKAPEKSKAH